MPISKEMEDKIELIAKHKVHNYLTEAWFSAQSFESNQKLLKQSQDFLQKEFSEIKGLIKDFIHESKEIYAPKTIVKEVDQHSADIRDLYKHINWINMKIAMASWVWGAIMFWISKL